MAHIPHQSPQCGNPLDEFAARDEDRQGGLTQPQDGGQVVDLVAEHEQVQGGVELGGDGLLVAFLEMLARWPR